MPENLKIPESYSLLKLPPYYHEVNPVENIWEYLRGNILSHTVFDDYDHVISTFFKAWNFLTNDPARVASDTSRTGAQVNL